MAFFHLSEQQFNAKFRQFADSLKADDHYHDEGIRLCENLRRHLEQQSKFQDFSIHSTIYGGSIGKKTDVQTPDFDITMKINNRRPPFNDVLDFFERELRQNHVALRVNLSSFKRTRFSVQFAFTDGKEVDLLPGVPNWTLEDVLRELKRNPRMRRYYSSTLVDSKVQFMKDQGAFAHAMARLAKYWYKNMELGDEYLSAGSTIFELMGVATTLDNRDGEESVLKRFDSLIKMVENFEQIKLSFEKPHYGSWKVSRYNSYQFPPYVLDPSNPQDNLLRGTKLHALTMIQNNGKAMRQRFTKFQNKVRNNQLGDVDTEIKLLFKA